MKRTFLLILPILIVACSTPKYTYHFDHYDYNSGRKKNLVASETRVATTEPEFTASTEKVIVAEKEAPKNTVAVPTEQMDAKAKYNTLSREEKKSLRKELKSELKKFKKASKEENVDANGPQVTNEMDRDLRLAIIFGAVGLVLSLLSGISAAFWVLAVIAIVVGVVFLIRWLMKQ